MMNAIMRRYTPLAAGLLAVLLAAAWTRGPAPVEAQEKPRAFRDVLEEYVGQTCGFRSSYAQYYLHFPEDKKMNWQTTKLVAVGSDFVHIRWDDEERYVPIGHVELLVGKTK